MNNNIILLEDKKFINSVYDDSTLLEDINYDINDSKMELLEDVDKGERIYMLKGVFARGNYANLNKRVYPNKVLGEAYKLIKESMDNEGAMLVGENEHPCLTNPDFDIMTDKGWKKFLSFDGSENVMSFDENNNIIFNKVNNIINEPFEGKVYHFKNKNIDSTFTGKHRFYLEDRYGIRQIVTAEEIFKNRTKYSHSKIIKNGSWIGNGKDTIEISYGEETVIFDAFTFFGFMGIYLSEGSIKHTFPNYSDIHIHQNKGKKADKIRELLTELGVDFKEYTRGKSINFSFNCLPLKKYLLPLGNKYQKYIPQELKEYDSIYLSNLLEYFLLGDSRDRRTAFKDKYANVFSVSKKLIDDLQECLIKVGGSGNIRVIESKKDYFYAGRLIKAENKKPLYQLNFSSTKGIYLDKRTMKISEEDYKGNIYCIQVDNGNFYMRQNNKSFLTGNSSGAKINMDRISCYFPELTFNEETGELSGVARPSSTPQGEILKGLMKDGIRVGFSTRCSGKVKPYRGPLGEGLVEVQPGLRLIAIDAVMNPSAKCFPKAIIESTEEESKYHFMSGVSNFKTIWETNFLRG